MGAGAAGRGLLLVQLLARARPRPAGRCWSQGRGAWSRGRDAREARERARGVCVRCAIASAVDPRGRWRRRNEHGPTALSHLPRTCGQCSSLPRLSPVGAISLPRRRGRAGPAGCAGPCRLRRARDGPAGAAGTSPRALRSRGDQPRSSRSACLLLPHRFRAAGQSVPYRRRWRSMAGRFDGSVPDDDSERPGRGGRTPAARPSSSSQPVAVGCDSDRPGRPLTRQGENIGRGSQPSSVLSDKLEIQAEILNDRRYIDITERYCMTHSDTGHQSLTVKSLRYFSLL